MPEDIAAKLERMAQVWATGKDTPPGPPDGVYELQVQSADIRAAATSGKLMTFWEFLVIGGDYEGNVFRDVISLEMESGPYRVGQRLRRLQLEVPDNVAELPEALELVTQMNPLVRGRIRHSGDFINVTVQELLDSAPNTVEGTPAQGPTAPTAEAPSETATTPEPSSPFQIGTKVVVSHEGREIHAVIKTVDRKAGSATLEDEDHLYEEVPLEDLVVEGEKPTADPEPNVEAVGKDEEALLQFALSQQLDDPGLEPGAELKHLVDVIDSYPWQEEELTDAEVKLLRGHGIIVAAPKKRKKKKAD